MTENSIKTRRAGCLGEDAAEKWLVNQGKKVLAKRYLRRGIGEIDLIVQDDDVISFVEVKDWNKYSLESLEQSIDLFKKRRILETAEVFLAENTQYKGFSLRFDVLFRHEKGEWKYIMNAFEFDG